MRLLSFLATLTLLALACGAPAVDTAGPEPSGDTDPDDTEPCTDPYMKVNGPEEPVPGDSWTVFLWCDRTLLTGPYVLRFEPPDFAMVDANVATFIAPGTATMTLHVGSYQDSMEVVVQAADTGWSDPAR